jgi:putative peptidoglycan lipid II flippase
VVVLVLAAVGVAAWSLSRGLHHSPATAPSQSSSSSSSPSAAAAAVPLKPVSASVYNPLGDPNDDDPSGTPAAIDGDTSTAWHTSFYVDNPIFGGTKAGSGLIIDMGRQVRLSQLTVQFGATCCTHVQIELGNSKDGTKADPLPGFTQVQTSASAANSTTFDVTSKATGRYVLIWITDLPPLAGQSDHFETLIYNVTVRGFTTGQSG